MLPTKGVAIALILAMRTALTDYEFDKQMRPHRDYNEVTDTQWNEYKNKLDEIINRIKCGEELDDACADIFASLRGE